MLVPFLVAAGLGVGVWWLLREDADEGDAPALPPPDEVDLVAANKGTAPEAEYRVVTFLLNNDQDSYHNMADFATWRAAWEYYKQVVAFLDENYPHWTCPQNSGYAMVTVIDKWARQKAVKTYTDCPGASPYSKTAGLRDWIAPIREFFEELAGTSEVVEVKRYPFVRLGMVTKDGAGFYGTWEFSSTAAAVKYFHDLQEAFRTKDAVEFYRPEGGRLVLTVGWPDWEVGFKGGRYAAWTGTEVPNSEGLVVPSEKRYLQVDFL